MQWNSSNINSEKKHSWESLCGGDASVSQSNLKPPLNACPHSTNHPTGPVPSLRDFGNSVNFGHFWFGLVLWVWSVPSLVQGLSDSDTTLHALCCVLMVDRCKKMTEVPGLKAKEAYLHITYSNWKAIKWNVVPMFAWTVGVENFMVLVKNILMRERNMRCNIFPLCQQTSL